MKLGLALIGFLALAVSAAWGQSQELQGSVLFTNVPTLRYKSQSPDAPAESRNNTASIQPKRLHLSGSLVEPLKSRPASEIPKRVVQLFNPFAPAEPKPEPPRVEKLSPRAWTTVAGWNPGRSAFADPVTHESQMGLIKFSRGATE